MNVLELQPSADCIYMILQQAYVDTDHLWASRRPMPEGKFPRQARGINKNFPNNQSVP